MNEVPKINEETIDEKARSLYPRVLKLVEQDLSEWGYEMREYDKSRLMVLCREVLAQFEEQSEHYKKIGRILDGAFSPSQEIKERFYIWLSEHGTQEVAKKIKERESEDNNFYRRNYERMKKQEEDWSSEDKQEDI